MLGKNTIKQKQDGGKEGWRGGGGVAELRSCVKVEVAILAPHPISLMIPMDVKQH